jgi:hypothetical protein
LNARPANGITQAEMHTLKSISNKEVEAIFGSPEATLQNLRALDGVKTVKIIAFKIDSNKKVTCLFTEYETTRTDGLVSLMQSWVCPAGNKLVKLATSYNKDEANIFKPIIKYSWESLRF